MKNVNPFVAALAVIGALVVLGWLLRITFALLPLLVLLAIGVFVYILIQEERDRQGPIRCLTTRTASSPISTASSPGV